MPTRVLVTDHAWPSLDIERGILGDAGAELVVAESGDADELVALAADADAILTNWKRVPPEALDAASRCLLVSRYGVGLDNIPVDHATELGILVTNVPDFCLEEVSDHAMALVLACARRVVMFARATQSGVWDLAAGRGLPRLAEQTIGLIGYGNTARALVPKARGFGLRVLAYTPRVTPATGEVALTNDLDRVLSRVGLHLVARAGNARDSRSHRRPRAPPDEAHGVPDQHLTWGTHRRRRPPACAPGAMDRGCGARRAAPGATARRITPCSPSTT